MKEPTKEMRGTMERIREFFVERVVNELSLNDGVIDATSREIRYPLSKTLKGLHRLSVDFNHKENTDIKRYFIRTTWKWTRGVGTECQVLFYQPNASGKEMDYPQHVLITHDHPCHPIKKRCEEILQQCVKFHEV